MIKISRAERGIQAYYQEKTEEEERRAWGRMEISNKYFFKYAKSKMRYKSPIGPFMSDKGDLIEESPCNTLNKEYFDVFVAPDPEDGREWRI